MQLKLEILKKGDSVLNVWNEHIAVKRKNGNVEIYRFYLDEDGIPRIAENTILICQGNGSVSTKFENTEIEVTTF